MPRHPLPMPPTGHTKGQRAGIGRAKPAFERLSQPGSGCFAPVQRHPWPSRRKRRHPDPGGRFAVSAVGTSIPDHDVSGAGWQILGRAMQSITTMMPVWQCGHTRNDWPVNASKRSR